MSEQFPLRPEQLPPEYLHHLAQDTRAMTEFFLYLYPAITDGYDTLDAQPISRAQDRMNDWGDPIVYEKPDWPEW